MNDGESKGDFVDAEDWAYSQAYQAVMNIYTAKPLDYDRFIELLDQTFGDQHGTTETKSAIFP